MPLLRYPNHKDLANMHGIVQNTGYCSISGKSSRHLGKTRFVERFAILASFRLSVKLSRSLCATYSISYRYGGAGNREDDVPSFGEKIVSELPNFRTVIHKRALADQTCQHVRQTLPVSPPSNCDFGIDCAILDSLMPVFSIIIAVYNDWTALDSCLHSVTQQEQIGQQDFEVIVVDDGSNDPAPREIRQWADRLPLTFIRQSHAGISAARNHGIQLSQASILVFVDADCRLRTNCLAALASTVAASPHHNHFQLCLAGDCAGFVGKTEHLRLTTLQNHMLQPDGCIRYLNTAGFAIRRSCVSSERGLFDPVALRGEDTLLLALLIERGELPFFVADAVVQHEVPFSLLKCLRKDIRSAFLEGGTYSLIASRGVRIRMSNRERLRVLWSMWKRSKQPSIGRAAGFLLIVRQSLARISSWVYKLLRGRSHFCAANSSSLNENP